MPCGGLRYLIKLAALAAIACAGNIRYGFSAEVGGGSRFVQTPQDGAPPEPLDSAGETSDSPLIDGLPPEPSDLPLSPRQPSALRYGEDSEAGPLEGTPPDPDQKPIAPDAIGRGALSTPQAIAEKTTTPVVLRTFLTLRAVDRFYRAPFQQDAIEAALISGELKPTQEGDTVQGSTGIRRRWESMHAGEDGWIRESGLRGGYALATYDSPREEVLLLHARGHSMVYVNGAPRVGDTYDNGWLQVPVLMRKGTNEFLFHLGRGELLAELLPPEGEVVLGQQDATLPDLIVGEDEAKWGAVWVINATDRPLEGASLVSLSSDGSTLKSGPIRLPPLSVRKVPFRLDGRVESNATEAVRKLQLVAGAGEERRVLDETALQLNVAEPGDLHLRTFISDVDGSVQYYAVQPARSKGTLAPSQKPGLIVSLHGAAVAAESQAGQYAPKSWAHIIAPTNRRPFGFDWEEWGRIDALEALDDAQQRLEVDPRRIYLTGHSMGGHGAWHLGTTFPGRFAAVGSSAAWISFETYTQADTRDRDSPLARIFARAANPGDPLMLKGNLASLGIYVLHGSQDENVPVSEARRMCEELAEFHTDFAYFEQRGAGHWWGSRCVDWPPMMDFLSRHERPDANDDRQIDFTTVNPGVSAQSGWVTIEAQERQLLPSRVVIECDAKERRFTGTTDNVARMALDVSHLEPESTIRIELDGQRLRDVRWPNVTRTIWLTRAGSRWRASTPPPPDVKGPERYGLFKDAFRNRAVLVYGTRGNDAEDRWALAKARFDAETFLYRGNGAFEVVADREFNPSEFADRNVVLYGNADTNGAWPALLSTCPVQVRRGAVHVGARAELGDDLGCLFVYPRRGSNHAVIGVVSGTGLVGMHCTNRLRYFVSGVAYPDLVIFDAGVLRDGERAVRAAGFFGLDWQIESGEIVWRDLAL